MAIANTAALTSSPPPTIPECGERFVVANDTVGIFPSAVVRNGGCLLVVVVTGLLTLFVADHDDDDTIVSASAFLDVLFGDVSISANRPLYFNNFITASLYLVGLKFSNFNLSFCTATGPDDDNMTHLYHSLIILLLFLFVVSSFLSSLLNHLIPRHDDR